MSVAQIKRSVLPVGDFHVRRVKENKAIDFFKHRGWSLTCIHRGRATVAKGYLDFNFPKADIIILMIGSNDISNGYPARGLLSILIDKAKFLLANQRAKHVIIMSLWARNSRQFNQHAKYFNSLGTCLYGNPGITFWQLSKKLTVKLSLDGVHCIPRTYARSARYILSAVVWVAKTKCLSLSY